MVAQLFIVIRSGMKARTQSVLNAIPNTRSGSLMEDEKSHCLRD